MVATRKPKPGRPAMPGEPLVQVSIKLREDQRAWLARHAAEQTAKRQQRVSLADVVRWAVDVLIEQGGTPTAPKEEPTTGDNNI